MLNAPLRLVLPIVVALLALPRMGCAGDADLPVPTATATATDISPSAPAPAIDEAEYLPYAKVGTGVITGRVVANTKSFGWVYFAKSEVDAIPFTTYNVWYIKRWAWLLHKGAFAKGDKPLKYPSDLAKYSRSATSDANGYFRFEGLPPGRYILSDSVQKESYDRPVIHRTRSAVDAEGNVMDVRVERLGIVYTGEVDVIARVVRMYSGRNYADVPDFDIIDSYIGKAGIAR